MKIYLDFVFGKLVCCKERRGFEVEKPPWGFERDLEILPVGDADSLEACWDTFCNARSNSGDFDMVSTQC